MNEKIEKYCAACITDKQIAQAIRNNRKGRNVYFLGDRTLQLPPNLSSLGQMIPLSIDCEKPIKDGLMIFFNLDVELFLRINWIIDFKPVNDYLIIKRSPKRVPPGDYREKEFTDSYMNKVKGLVTEDIIIYLKGSFSKVILNEYKKIGSLKIHLDDFSDVTFQDSAFIYDLEMTVDRYCNVVFGCNCVMRNNSIIFCRDNSSIEVGKRSTFGKNLTIVSHNTLKIGEDCLVSSDCTFQCGDGHSIFDINTGMLCNDTRIKSEKNIIDVGDHVWLGLRSTILNGTKIGAGCMIACGFVVKGQFSNNCMIGGVLARVLRENIAWCHEKNMDDIGRCGKYAKKTEIY